MKRIFYLSAVLLFTVVINFACSKSDSGGNGGGGGGTTTPTIRMTAAMTYSPATLTVKQNTVINLTNDASVTHSVTSDNGTTFDKDVPGGTTVTYNCPTVGTFPFHCKFHAGMNGTLTVTP
ncbi:MAG TPA: cupredoxin domain-containing protein [Chitinophagaceae bacterium]|nr:cupredoxin domain-containing protein [Chitinophagaceae bacterium]